MNRTVLASYLLGLYLVSAAINLYLLQHAAGYTPSLASDSIRAEIASVHGVLIAILIGGIFVKGKDSTRVSALTAALSVVLSILWAAYITLSWKDYPMNINADALLAQIGARSKEGSFLVAGMLAYVCGSEVKPTLDQNR